MARPSSIAEHYRAHREVFSLAQELGCTPREAQAEMACRAAKARWEETAGRLRARMEAAPRARASAPVENDAARAEPWMMRD